MPPILYLVRHCRATGQEPDAPLTPEAHTEAERLAAALAPHAIDRIISSPFRRARDSIAPFAAQRGLSIETDARLVEQVLSPTPVPDWQDTLRAGFADPDLALPGGESARVAQARGIAVVQEVLARPGRGAVLVTHGALLTLLLRHFDPRVGYAEWARLSNPDLFRVEMRAGAPRVERLWR